MKPFRYVRFPRSPLTGWIESSTPCGICGTAAPGWGGCYYGVAEIEHVCEACLRTGRLTEVECTSEDGDQSSLRAQLADQHPTMSAEEREALATERDQVLSTMTPSLETWQDLFWPAHCGDYCEFIEELGRPEITELAVDKDPERWLTAHLIDAEFPCPWDAIRQKSARESPEEAYELTVYRFDCRECGEILVHWDAS